MKLFRNFANSKFLTSLLCALTSNISWWMNLDTICNHKVYTEFVCVRRYDRPSKNIKNLEKTGYCSAICSILGSRHSSSWMVSHLYSIMDGFRMIHGKKILKILNYAHSGPWSPAPYIPYFGNMNY